MYEINHSMASSPGTTKLNESTHLQRANSTMQFDHCGQFLHSPIKPTSLFRATVALLCLFLLGFHFNGMPAGYDIDPSWSAVMSWGLVNGAKWGRDIIFTYGPLSFLSAHYSYFSATFLIASVGQVLLTLLYIGV